MNKQMERRIEEIIDTALRFSDRGEYNKTAQRTKEIVKLLDGLSVLEIKAVVEVINALIDGYSTFGASD